MKRTLTLAALAAACIRTAVAADPYLHILSGTGSVASVPVDKSSVISHAVDADGQNRVILSRDNAEPLIFKGEAARYWWIAPEVPTLTIITDHVLPEVPDKENYLDALISIDSKGRGTDFEGRVKIRGRGHSSWLEPKKPYRLKFESKTSVLGYKKAKSYVLVANWCDPSMLRNIIATKAAQLLEMPYTNTITPVEVTFNGIYKGSYLFTEKVGMNSGSVDLTEGEDGMFELDSYFDDALQFITYDYELPAMYKEDGITQEQFDFWRKDFGHMVSTLARSSRGDREATELLPSLLDMEQAAKYILVNNLACNHELMHPKSVYLYKPRDGKYAFGPVWDFDWGFGKDPAADDVLIENSLNQYGYKFFLDIVRHPAFMPVYKKVWEDFRDNKLTELFAYIDSYARMAMPSDVRSIHAWDYRQEEYVAHRKKTMEWLERRIRLIDNAVANYMLY